MRRRTPVVLIGLIAFSLLAGCKGGCGKAPRPSPAPVETNRAVPAKNANIVWISFDALQASRVGASGYKRSLTPNFDDFAAMSFQFTRAYSVAPWTVPSTMTWFTGVYPSEHRIVNKYAEFSPLRQTPANLRELAPHLTTLAEVLRGEGYATAAFTGNAGVSGRFGFDRGFDLYDCVEGRFGGFERSLPHAVDWLKTNRDRKFFLFLHGYDVHGQYEPEAALDYRYVDPGYDRKFSGTIQEQEILREEGLAKGSVKMRLADVDFWRAVYDEKVARADAKFGAFLKAYAELGLMENTLFVFASDHGTELHEHGRFDHGFALFDEHLRVPFAIRMPGQTRGVKIDSAISSIDCMPTVIDLSGSELPPTLRKQLRGRSLLDRMNGGGEPTDLFAETDYRQFTYKRGIVAPDGFKYIRTLESDTRELYDTRADPAELRNLNSEQPGRAKELDGKLVEHFQRIGCDFRELRWEVGLNPVYPSQAPGAKK